MLYLFFIAIILLACYLGIVVILYFAQEFLFFHPEKLPQDFEFQFGLPFDELFFETEAGAKINALHFQIGQPKGVVLYVKGNSRSIKGWAKFAKDFTGIGYDVLLFDYRGFGKSIGKRTEESLYYDTQYIYNWLKNQYKEEDIIIYGRSMGSGFAAKIAADNNPRMLILDAPYYSFLHLMRTYLPFIPVKWILKYKIHTHRFMQEVACPVHVFHGSHDWTIPIWAGVRLARALGPQSNFISIRGAGHNNLRNFPKYHEHLYYIFK